jgi:hypothetical protein
MGTPWEPDKDEECWSDREAWRGESHPDAASLPAFEVEVWRGEGEGLVWAEPEETVTEEREWLEDLAGPEYWLFKRFGD